MCALVIQVISHRWIPTNFESTPRPSGRVWAGRWGTRLDLWVPVLDTNGQSRPVRSASPASRRKHPYVGRAWKKDLRNILTGRHPSSPLSPNLCPHPPSLEPPVTTHNIHNPIPPAHGPKPSSINNAGNFWISWPLFGLSIGLVMSCRSRRSSRIRLGTIRVPKNDPLEPYLF